MFTFNDVDIEAICTTTSGLTVEGTKILEIDS